jgi:hypothetical protein
MTAGNTTGSNMTGAGNTTGGSSIHTAKPAGMFPVGPGIIVDPHRLPQPFPSHPHKLNVTHLPVLENQGFISYQKGDGIYTTTYKGRQFLRTYNHAIKLLSNSEKEIQSDF